MKRLLPNDLRTFLGPCLIAFSLVCASEDHAAQNASVGQDIPMEWSENPDLPAGYREVGFPRMDGSEGNLFLTDPGEDLGKKKPLLVYVEGSGAQSLFYKLDDGRVAVGILGPISDHAKMDYHVASVEKRGVPFGSMGQRGIGEGASEEYTRHATLLDREVDIRSALTVLLADPRVDASRVILLGHSEGADVVAAVAAEDERVTHVAFLSGGGAMQFFDMFVLQRRMMEEAGATAEEIESSMESLEEEVRDILRHPESETKFWRGHAYKRWSTFATQAPADYLVKAKASILLAHGSADTSVPIESFDYLVAKLLCTGREDVTVLRFPDRDHSFIPVGEEPGYTGFLEVLEEVLAWADFG